MALEGVGLPPGCRRPSQGKMPNCGAPTTRPAPQHPGASNGIGAALATRFAAPGIYLTLTGRDAARLEGVADACRARGAHVASVQVDVADAAGMAAAMKAAHARCPVDLVVANAGVMESDAPLTAALPAAAATNVCGALNTVLPALDAMLGNGGHGGHIALVSSVSALPAASVRFTGNGEGRRGRGAKATERVEGWGALWQTLHVRGLGHMPAGMLQHSVVKGSNVR